MLTNATPKGFDNVELDKTLNCIEEIDARTAPASMEGCVFRIEKTLLFCNLLNPSKGGDGNSKVTVDTVDSLDARGTVDTVWRVSSVSTVPTVTLFPSVISTSSTNWSLFRHPYHISNAKEGTADKNLTNVQTNQCRDRFGRILPLAWPWSIHSHDLGSGYGSHEFLHKYPKSPNLDKNSFEVIYLPRFTKHQDCHRILSKRMEWHQSSP